MRGYVSTPGFQADFRWEDDTRPGRWGFTGKGFRRNKRPEDMRRGEVWSFSLVPKGWEALEVDPHDRRGWFSRGASLVEVLETLPASLRPKALEHHDQVCSDLRAAIARAEQRLQDRLDELEHAR